MRLKLMALFIFCATPVLAQTVAIRAGHLVNPANGTVAKDQIILVENGRIISVGPAIAIPPNAQVVDLSQEWVTPGLMDAHTHLTFVLGGVSVPLETSYLEESSAFRSLRGLKNAQIILQAGFTTVRDVGNEADYASVDLRRAINDGWFDGPTIITSGKIIAPFGGQSKEIPQQMGPLWKFEYIDADGPQEIRKAVRENIFYGADVIKLAADNSAYHYSVEEIQAAVDESHHAGRAVAVHVYGGEAADNVINGGADSIEHGFDLTDAQLRHMKEKGTYLVGTDFPRAQLIAMGPVADLVAVPDAMSKKIIDRLHRAYIIGVKMAFGSDTVIEMPGKTRADLMLDYLPVWKDAGVPSPEILKAMTTNAAELLEIKQQRGAIDPGLAADIIAMPANPLDDVEAVRKVNFVMKNGKVVRTLH